MSEPSTRWWLESRQGRQRGLGEFAGLGLVEFGVRGGGEIGFGLGGAAEREP